MAEGVTDRVDFPLFKSIAFSDIRAFSRFKTQGVDVETIDHIRLAGIPISPPPLVELSAD